MLQKFLLFVLILLAQLTVAITSSYSQTIVKWNEPCESRTAYVDAAASELVINSNILVIARLGKAENNLKYSQRRLQLIRERLDLAIPTKQIVLAYAERTEGKGRVEIYVNGILEVVFETPLKGNLVVGDCDVDFNEKQKSLLKTKLPRAL
jgi:hypothetical protein